MSRYTLGCVKIDAHQHFWRFDPKEYSWITDSLFAIKRDFLPEHLEPLLEANGITGSVAVQARQTLEETRWLLELAEANPFIKGVVGWLPLQDPGLEEVLDQWAPNPRFVGARHVVQDETDPEFIIGKRFNEGVRELGKRGLVYDILIFERQLAQTIVFVDRHPDMQFVLDHIAKPKIRRDAFDEEWARNLATLSQRPNVACKLSGMVTEVIDPEWDDSLLEPYFQTAIDTFGPDRLLLGSDWPVCLLRTDYHQWQATLEKALSRLSVAEQAKVRGENAKRLYKLV